MDLSLFFAGTAGSVPSARRGLPAILMRRGGDRILFDCGEGTQRQLVRSVGLADVEEVFLTHLHTDHWLGLPGMLRTFDLRDRERDLTVYGPPGLTALMKAMYPIYGRTAYRLQITELDPYDEVEHDGYRIGAVPVRHRGVAYGYAILEDSRPGRFDAALATSLGVRPGPDFGRLQRGETVGGISPERIVGPDREGRKVVISGDTTPCDALLAAAHRADLLVHEATFVDAELERAQLTRHSTARQAAAIAAEAEVGLLALVHVSGRYAGREVRDEARAGFARSVVPRDFDTIEVPYPEKGAPELIHWEPAPPHRSEPDLPPECENRPAP
jgi:ribonuclease Z